MLRNLCIPEKYMESGEFYSQAGDIMGKYYLFPLQWSGFLAEKARQMEISQIAVDEKNQFISNGQLDMELVLQKFVSHYTELFGEYHEHFLEDNGRCIFLLYMKPIINGAPGGGAAYRISGRISSEAGIYGQLQF